MIYVEATSESRAEIVAQLQTKGYAVCEVLAAVAPMSLLEEENLPPEMAECILGADICILLLPEDPKNDGMIGRCAAAVDQAGHPMVCVVAGARSEYPEAIDDHSQSLVRAGSTRFDAALDGVEMWEEPSGELRKERPFTTVKCQ
ncbi:hypothetical protein [Phenylobacterium sp.]|uniref:hypothetical protein n=1 Tax=Phenylobacterium sp. TaxID=1871053 RepID=UPI0040354F9F